MFIKAENGDLINTRFVYRIKVSKHKDGKFGVYAYIQMDGNTSLGTFDTEKEANECKDKYFQMN